MLSKLIKKKSPFSLKLVLVALFLLALGLMPMQEQDLIVEVLVYTSALIIILFGIELCLQYLFFSKNLQVKLNGPATAKSEQVSAEKLELVLNNAKILPLLEFKIEPVWDYLDSPIASFLFTGLNNSERKIDSDINFPHRGVWVCSHANYKFSDHFGFFKFEGTIKLKETYSCRVEPSENSYSELPILSSVQREGTDVPSQENPQGDPLELKAYHPSDGLKKIAWKIYARSSELLSRHPEPSMSPEGKIGVLTLAGRDKDAAARLSLNYLKKAEERELLILASCLGNGELSKSETKLAISSQDFKDLLINTAWDANYSSACLMQALAPHLEIHKNQVYSNLLIFISEGECENSEYLAILEELGKILYNEKIEPIFLVARDYIDLPIASTEQTPKFYQLCITNNWQIYKEQ